jgi:hypothetical protein
MVVWRLYHYGCGGCLNASSAREFFRPEAQNWKRIYIHLTKLVEGKFIGVYCTCVASKWGCTLRHDRNLLPVTKPRSDVEQHSKPGVLSYFVCNYCGFNSPGPPLAQHVIRTRRHILAKFQPVAITFAACENRQSGKFAFITWVWRYGSRSSVQNTGRMRNDTALQ